MPATKLPMSASGIWPRMASWKRSPTIDHTITAVPLELRGGYTGYWRAADVLEFTSHGYDGYVFDENNNRIDFKGYRADCINQFALDYLDQYTGEKPFFMTVSQIEPHHQNDHNHYEGPNGSKQRFADFVLPEDSEGSGRQCSRRVSRIIWASAPASTRTSASWCKS